MTPEVLGRSRPPVSIQDFTPEQIHRFLRQRLAARAVQQAWLFGSAATGEAGAWSDLDLVIVHPSDQPFIERPREFFDLYDLGLPIDLLVYTPEEFARLQHSDSPFWRQFQQQKLRIL